MGTIRPIIMKHTYVRAGTRPVATSISPTWATWLAIYESAASFIHAQRRSGRRCIREGGGWCRQVSVGTHRKYPLLGVRGAPCRALVADSVAHARYLPHPQILFYRTKTRHNWIRSTKADPTPTGIERGIVARLAQSGSCTTFHEPRPRRS